MKQPTLTLTELLLIRKWLRRCHQTCEKYNNDQGTAELTALGQKINALIDTTPGGNHEHT